MHSYIVPSTIIMRCGASIPCLQHPPQSVKETWNADFQLQQEALVPDSARVRRKRDPFPQSLCPSFPLPQGHQPSAASSPCTHACARPAPNAAQRQSRFHTSHHVPRSTQAFTLSPCRRHLRKKSQESCNNVGDMHFQGIVALSNHAIRWPESPMQMACWFLADQAHLKRSCACKMCAKLNSNAVGTATIAMTRLLLFHTENTFAHGRGPVVSPNYCGPCM